MSNSHPSVLKYPITTQLGTDHDQPPPPCNPRANAFLIPARPYLERVAAFPRDGREAQLAGVREMVNEIKKIDGDAWAAAGEGCGRIMVSAHDTGTFAASEADQVVRRKAVFITANADTTTDAERLEAEVSKFYFISVVLWQLDD